MSASDATGQAMTPGPPKLTDAERYVDQQVAREAIFQTVNLVLGNLAWGKVTRGEAFPPQLTGPGRENMEQDGSEVLVQQGQFAKTGELLQLEVLKTADKGFVLRGHEVSTGQWYSVPLDSEI